ncbi:MAG: BamA/TamA family outer membrane protein [Gemmatimonadaceae bacterium]|nr:BamA/TamA family outer membrane protein [Gemmatimonadaceae bacterium]
MLFLPFALAAAIVAPADSVPRATAPSPRPAPATAQGASADSAPRIKILAVPALTSQPETGFAFAALGYLLHLPADGSRPGQYEFGAQITQKSQWRIFGDVDRWWGQNAWRVQGQLEYRVYPLPFYGNGPTAPKANEEIYTAQGVLASGTLQRRLSPRLFVQGGFRLSALEIDDVKDGGLLEPDTIPGARGATFVQWRSALLFDTRDDILAPQRGAFVTLGAGAAIPNLISGGWSYTRANVDARVYRTRGRVTLAAQAVAEGLTGSAPFDDLPLLGTKSYMRGYALGRYRDRALAAAQIETRVRVKGRLVLAAFAGGGEVARNFQSMSLGRLLPSYGAGARWRIFATSQAHLRLDIASGHDGRAFYLNLNEAF